MLMAYLKSLLVPRLITVIEHEENECFKEMYTKLLDDILDDV